MPELTNNIAKTDYIGFWKGEAPDYQRISDFLDMNKREASQMAGVARTTVRYDDRIPRELADRLEQIANIVNRVAAIFDGDLIKTGLWFRTPNPLLGEVSPRDMLRMDRYKRLSKFVTEAEQSQ